MATADVRVLSEVRLHLLGRLERHAEGICVSINALCATSHFMHPELREKFQAAVADIERVTIEALAERAGTFSVRNGVLRIAEDPVARLLDVVVRDISSRVAETGEYLLDEEIPELLERVFTTFVLHELRHRTQGLEDYSDVGALKDIAGLETMSEFDLLADRDAACAFAALYADDKGRTEFLCSFRQALFFSSRYYFQAFPIPANRPDKIARAIGILLMAARLARKNLRDPIQERADLPLDAPIYVSLSTRHNRLAIYRGEPSRAALGFANDEQEVAGLISDIVIGDFNSALERAIVIMTTLKLME